MSILKSLRFPAGLLERIESLAKEKRLKFSQMAMIAFQRGVAALEHEQLPPPAPNGMSRRRVFSKGVE